MKNLPICTFIKGTIFIKGSMSYSQSKLSSKDKCKDNIMKASKDKLTPMKSSQNDKKCFKCHGYRHFQVNCPNRKVMTLKKIEEIEKAYQNMEDNKVEEMENKKDEEIIKADNRNMLMFHRALHIQNNPYEDQGLTYFKLYAPSMSRCVWTQWMVEVVLMWF